MIDLHTAALHRDNFPQIRALLGDPETRRLAEAFGAPVMLDAGLREGSIRQVAHALGIPVLVYEGGEALRFDELAIRAGVRGILSVMRALGMLPPSRVRHKTPTPVLARGSTWVRAPASGIVRSVRPLGAQVGEGDTLAVISDPFGETEAPAIAPVPGILIGKSNLPLAIEGEALFNIARVPRPGQVEERVGAYAEALAEADELADFALFDDNEGS
jgi:predicted deacylase